MAKEIVITLKRYFYLKASICLKILQNTFVNVITKFVIVYDLIFRNILPFYFQDTKSLKYKKFNSIKYSIDLALLKIMLNVDYNPYQVNQ
jgi:hypothetical protein